MLWWKWLNFSTPFWLSCLVILMGSYFSFEVFKCEGKKQESNSHFSILISFWRLQNLTISLWWHNCGFGAWIWRNSQGKYLTILPTIGKESKSGRGRRKSRIFANCACHLVSFNRKAIQASVLFLCTTNRHTHSVWVRLYLLFLSWGSG